jgi:hypothetical protein
MTTYIKQMQRIVAEYRTSKSLGRLLPKQSRIGRSKRNDGNCPPLRSAAVALMISPQPCGKNI